MVFGRVRPHSFINHCINSFIINEFHEHQQFGIASEYKTEPKETR
jgi:hypothetical protein